jgi:hypothetical protein
MLILLDNSSSMINRIDEGETSAATSAAPSRRRTKKASKDQMTRSSTAYKAIDEQLLKPSVERTDKGEIVVVSFVLFAADAIVILHRQKLTQSTRQLILDCELSSPPSGHGNYLPAIGLAQEIFISDIVDQNHALQLYVAPRAVWFSFCLASVYVTAST